MIEPLGTRLRVGGMVRVWVLLSAVLLAAGCTATPEARPPDPQVVWRALGSWQGRGNKQTESFTSDSGSIRVQWQASDVTAPGEGSFRLTIHSAISGRPLQEAVDHHGVGAGTAFVSEDPRVFFAVVESADLAWSFTLEEAVLVDQKRP